MLRHKLVQKDEGEVRELEHSLKRVKNSESKSKRLQNHLTITYGKWKSLAKEAKKALDRCLSGEILQDHMTKIHCLTTDVKQAYEDLRQHIVHDREAAAK